MDEELGVCISDCVLSAAAACEDLDIETCVGATEHTFAVPAFIVVETRWNESLFLEDGISNVKCVTFFGVDFDFVCGICVACVEPIIPLDDAGDIVFDIE